MIRIALLSSTPLSARRLEGVVRLDSTIELLTPCCSIEMLFAQISQSDPEVILLDVNPELSFAALDNLKRKARHAKLVLLANAVSTEFAMRAMELGISGILRKTLPADLQLKCLQRIHAGELWFERALADPEAEVRQAELTTAEATLVTLLSQGLKNWEIADCLSISEDEVKEHLARLFGKLEVKDRFELALFGLKNHASQADSLARRYEIGALSLHTLRSLIQDKRPDKERSGDVAPVLLPTLQ